MYHKFIDHGTPIDAEEERTAALCTKEEDTRFVIASKGFVLIVDIDMGSSKQVFFPEGNKEYPFASFSSNGLFYTGAGNMLLVLDPFLERFIDYQMIENEEEIVGFSFAEDLTGNIFFTTYPQCFLLSYNPETKSVMDYGSMHSQEKYPSSLAVDEYGWVYIGVGTEFKDIIAFHLKTGKKKNLIPSSLRQKGSGYVYLGTDGFVYGHMEASDMRDVLTASQWLKFTEGEFQAANYVAPSYYGGAGFQKIHHYEEASYEILSYSLSERYVEIVEKKTGVHTTIQLNYQSDGAELSTIYLDISGYIYGTSMHPLQFFQFDISNNSFKNFGALEKGGGGNICAYASQGDLLVGVAYAGGKLYVHNMNQKSEKPTSPRLILEEEHIHRPRCALATSDKKEVVWGGFPGYGVVGGALAFFHIETEKHTVISNNNILPYHSTICLSELRNGDIVGGTSVEAPGGAKVKAQDANLYVLDKQTKQLKYKFAPYKGTREIISLYTDSYDYVHGVTEKGLYFVWMPSTNTIITEKNLSHYGEPIRSCFVFDELTQSLYCLMSKGLFVKNLQYPSAEVLLVEELPTKASSGIALYQKRIYYGSGSHLYSVSLD